MNQQDDPQDQESRRGRSSAPLAATFDHPYACPNDHNANATALRAVPDWDTRYRDTGVYEPGRPTLQRGWNGNFYPTLPTWTAVIASNTSMLTFTATSSGPQSFGMIGGNVMTLAQDDDYIGSLVTANEPIAMWLSSETDIPFNWPSVNLTYLQVAPTSDWATEYAAVPFPSRYPPHDLGSIWRLVGDADGTMLTYDPAIAGAPTTIGAGDLSVFRTTTPFVVSAQDSAHDKNA